MSTLDRLRALVRGTGPGHPPSGPVRELTYEPVDASGLPLPTFEGLPALEGAAFVDTPAGRTLVVDRVFDGDAWHGRLRVRDALVDPCDVALLASDATSAPDDAASAETVLFLDLETTGLSGGAGTVAFLVGCGRFVDGAFHTRQFLLPGFAAERVLLGAVADFAGGAAAIVTYNGKTFDLPVMETRWAFHRLDWPLDAVAHLDMLHLARRLWGARDERAGEGGCRLVTLERSLFEFERTGDVSGWEIPSRYFEFVRRGDSAILAPVLQHNRLDLLSLACLTARASRLVRDGHAAAAEAPEAAALARELFRRRDLERAEACYRHALGELEPSSPHRADALHGLARLLRRQRRFAEAAALWHELARSGADVRGALRHEATEALAVHYEHRARDLASARSWAVRATGIPAAGRHRERLAHRMARLDRKIAGRHAPGSAPGLPLDGL